MSKAEVGQTEPKTSFDYVLVVSGQNGKCCTVWLTLMNVTSAYTYLMWKQMFSVSGLVD